MIKSHTKEMEKYIPDLFNLFVLHLTDCAWSVREDSACSIKTIVSYFKDYKDKALNIITEYLPRIFSEIKEDTPSDVIECKTSFGVLELVEADDTSTLLDTYSNEKHEDYGVINPPRDWEKTDGALYLLTELSELYPEIISNYVETLQKISEIRHLSHCEVIIETLWVELPIIMKNIGKRSCKRIVQPFITPLFDSLTKSSSPICSRSAGACIAFLNHFIGESIFRGRLEPDQLNLLMTHPLILNAIIPGTDDGGITHAQIPQNPSQDPRVKVIFGMIEHNGETKYVKSKDFGY